MGLSPPVVPDKVKSRQVFSRGVCLVLNNPLAFQTTHMPQEKKKKKRLAHFIRMLSYFDVFDGLPSWLLDERRCSMLL